MKKIIEPHDHDMGTDDHFLRAKSEAAAVQSAPDDESGPDPFADAFPEQRRGEAFVDYALDGLQDYNRAGVVALRVATDPSVDPAAACAGLVAAAQRIERLASSHQGVWGRLAADVLACAFADRDKSACRRWADALLVELTEAGAPVVTLGLAVHPTLDYSLRELFANAGKAVRHAAFHGAGVVVAFDDVSLNISGDDHYDRGDIMEAMGEYRRGLTLNPDNENLHNSLGVCYGVLGSLEKAMEQFESALRLNPQEVMALYNLGLIYLKMGATQKALAHFQQAAEIDSDTFEIVFQLGSLLLDSGDAAAGLALLEKAVGLQPRSALAQRRLGLCCQALDRSQEAIRAFKRAVRENPNDAESLSALGHLFDEQGERTEITTVFCKQSVDIDPANGLYRYRLGSLYLKQGELDQALEQLSQASALGHACPDRLETVRDQLLDREAGLEN